MFTPPNPANAERGKPPIMTVVIAALVVMAIAVSLWVVLRRPEEQPISVVQINAPTKMTSDEQAYVPSVRIENIALSRAENFIHQEVTILKAEAVNDGSRPLQRLFVTVEFSDDMHQIVLRETRGVLGTPPTPLAAGQRRTFEISFDRVPSSWNMQQPSVRVSYLQLVQ